MAGEPIPVTGLGQIINYWERSKFDDQSIDNTTNQSLSTTAPASIFHKNIRINQDIDKKQRLDQKFYNAEIIEGFKFKLPNESKVEQPKIYSRLRRMVVFLVQFVI